MNASRAIELSSEAVCPRPLPYPTRVVRDAECAQEGAFEWHDDHGLVGRSRHRWRRPRIATSFAVLGAGKDWPYSLLRE
jgi:hypothetical protein